MWRKLLDPLWSWKPPAELGKGVKFSTAGSLCSPPKSSHRICRSYTSRLESIRTHKCRFSSDHEFCTFPVKRLLARAGFPNRLVLLNTVQSFPTDRVWFMFVEVKCYVCSQLVLGRHSGRLKPSPLFVPRFHFHTARNTTDMPDKQKPHFLVENERGKMQSSNTVHCCSSVWTAGGGRPKMEELK